MVARRRLGHGGELAVIPRKFARFDDDAAHAGAVSAEELGGGMHHYRSTPLERPAQIGAEESIVDKQRQSGLGGDFTDRFQIEDVQGRVADGLGKQGLGFRRDGPGKAFRIVRIDEYSVDAKLAEIDIELGVGAAIQSTGSDDLVPGLADVEQGNHLSGHAAAHGNGGAAIL